MSTPVATPRRVFVSVAELARHLGCNPRVLLNGNYLVLDDARGYRLRPLDEVALERWHRLVWAPAQRRKGAA
jgi:hypothetical protein